jgi:signal peptidase complex subunit 1
MDYSGQELAETLANRIILFAAIVGMIAGYLLQSFMFTMCILGLGALVSVLVCVPNWSFYNSEWATLKWLPEEHPAFQSSSSST